eukprot:1159555-Pelagomonas_calceolata.AAC.7
MPFPVVPLSAPVEGPNLSHFSLSTPPISRTSYLSNPSFCSRLQQKNQLALNRAPVIVHAPRRSERSDDHACTKSFSEIAPYMGAYFPCRGLPSLKLYL